MKVIDYRSPRKYVNSPILVEEESELIASPLIPTENIEALAAEPIFQDSSENNDDQGGAVAIADSLNSPIDDTTQSSAFFENEEDIMDDIHLMTDAMTKKISEQLSRYQKKAAKALAEAKLYYKHRLNSSKALVYMRKYSYYKVRAETMKTARHQLSGMRKAIAHEMLRTPISPSKQTVGNTFNVEEFSANIHHLQGLMKKVPTQTRTDLDLMQELKVELRQDEAGARRSRKSSGSNNTRSSKIMYSPIMEH